MTTLSGNRPHLTDGLGDYAQFFDAMLAALPGAAIQFPGKPGGGYRIR